jgi:hypothetical protein
LPARADGKSQFSVRIGDVGRELKLLNRIPQVLSALRSRKFLEANGLKLVCDYAPPSAPSGQSTSVVLTFAFVGSAPTGAIRKSDNLFSALRSLAGSGRAVYDMLGGPEKALQDERTGYME